MDRNFEHIAIDRVGTDGRVARITLNRPERLNAIAPQTMGEFEQALRDLEADNTARVIIIRGAGRVFSAGHDLSGTELWVDPSDPTRKYPTTDEQGRLININFATALSRGTDVQMAFWRVAKITIVQAHGFCIAGGMEFAMMADLITASEDCVFGHPGHRGLGVARNGMILPLVLGMRKAKELFYTGDGISGKEAERIGLINYAWPDGDLEERTIAFADRIANQTADYLAVLKAAANRFYENMGIDSSVRSATLFDATAQNTGSNRAFMEKLAKDGLKAAVQSRDGPYGDYGTRQKPPQNGE